VSSVAGYCYQAHAWPLPRAAINSTLRAASSEQCASGSVSQSAASRRRVQSRARRWSIVALAND